MLKANKNKFFIERIIIIGLKDEETNSILSKTQNLSEISKQTPNVLEEYKSIYLNETRNDEYLDGIGLVKIISLTF